MSHIELTDRIDIIKCYYSSGESATAAIRKFKQKRRLIKDPFTLASVSNLVKKFEMTGSVQDRPKSGRPSLLEERSDVVLNALETTSSDLGCTSTRNIEAATAIPQRSVHRILRNALQLFPYRLSTQQHLEPSDFDARLQFANWMLDEMDRIPNILFSDECHFYLDGDINPKNCVIWNSCKPNVIVTKPLHSEKVTVWMGVAKDFITRPYFFVGSVNGESYLNMLKEHVLPELRRIRKVRSCIFMQDGAPPHIANPVKQFLVDHFGQQRVISRHFSQPWPARSPDLNPCDFWLWGDLQSKVYHCQKPQDLEELKRRICFAASQITTETMSAAIDNFQLRLQALFEQNGGHFQHLL